MCPFNLPPAASGRSRFTREPTRRSPRLLRRSVSGARSAPNESGCKSAAVRHTPFTAMLAPSVRSLITVAQRTRRRAPADSTTPSSSMIPVNIAFHGEFIRRYCVHGDVVNANGVGPLAPADAAGQWQRFHAAQNLGAVIKEDAVDATGFERRP